MPGLEEILKTVVEMPKAYEQADEDGKAEILKFFTEKVVLSDNTTRILWKKPFVFFITENMIRCQEKWPSSQSVSHAPPAGLEPAT